MINLLKKLKIVCNIKGTLKNSNYSQTLYPLCHYEVIYYHTPVYFRFFAIQ